MKRYSGRLEQQRARRRAPWDPSKRPVTQGQVDRMSWFGGVRRERSSAQFAEARAILGAGKLPYDVKPAPVQPRPFLGYDNPMADPRVEGYVELEYGRVVRRVGRPC